MAAVRRLILSLHRAVLAAKQVPSALASPAPVCWGTRIVQAQHPCAHHRGGGGNQLLHARRSELALQLSPRVNSGKQGVLPSPHPSSIPQHPGKGRLRCQVSSLCLFSRVVKIKLAALLVWRCPGHEGAVVRAARMLGAGRWAAGQSPVFISNPASAHALPK